MTAMSEIQSALVLRSSNWQLCRVADYAGWSCDTLSIEIKWPEDRASTQAVAIYVQGVVQMNLERALEYLTHITSNARLIRRLRLSVEVSDSGAADAVLDLLSHFKNVHLEEILIRRRYVGQKFKSIPRLVQRNFCTLRVLGKLGLSEAIEALNERVHLKRLTLMNFDLVENGEMESVALSERTRMCLRRLAGLGATFEHLSFYAYSGFELTKNPALFMLRKCHVSSVRLTMQSGVAITDPPALRPLLPSLRRLELIGSMEVQSNNISVLFPSLEDYRHDEKSLLGMDGETGNRQNQLNYHETGIVARSMSPLLTVVERPIPDRAARLAVSAF